MNQVMLCPDVQSPELSIPCPTHTLPEVTRGLTGSTSGLPDTGFDVWVYVIIATIMILIGAGIWLYEKHLEKQEAEL